MNRIKVAQAYITFLFEDGDLANFKADELSPELKEAVNLEIEYFENEINSEIEIQEQEDENE